MLFFNCITNIRDDPQYVGWEIQELVLSLIKGCCACTGGCQQQDDLAIALLAAKYNLIFIRSIDYNVGTSEE